MDLRTRYLDLDLASPFLAGASPFTQDLDMVLRLEDVGAPAIVMHSLFEEELSRPGAEPHVYLEQLMRIRQRVGVPVIASLNGTTAEGWLSYAKFLERAGAAALELNTVLLVAAEPGGGARSSARGRSRPLQPLLPAGPRSRAQNRHADAALFRRVGAAAAPPRDCRAVGPREGVARSDRRRPRAARRGEGGHGGADVVQIVSALITRGPAELTRLRDGFNYLQLLGSRRLPAFPIAGR